MPMLMSVDGLNRLCSGVKVDPIRFQGEGLLTTVNSSALDLVGSINLHFRFSGSSMQTRKDGKRHQSGQSMEHWYPIQVAVVANLSADFLMAASLIRTHEMRIDYSNNPHPTVVTNEGKWFPYYQYELSQERCSPSKQSYSATGRRRQQIMY